MSSPRRPHRTPLRIERLEDRTVPAAWGLETFDQLPSGALPSRWALWASSDSAPFATSTARPFSGPAGLAVTGPSNLTARAWLDRPQLSGYGARATVFVDSLTPVEVLARGRNLTGDSPTYYAATVTRGLNLQITRVVNGQAAMLASVRSENYVSGKWLRVTLWPRSDLTQAEVYDPASGLYLNGSGQWQANQAFALTVTDTAITGEGLAGVGRRPGYAGTVHFDNFTVIGPNVGDNFDLGAAGGPPAGWAQWASDGTPSFAVSSGRALSGSQALVSAGTSGRDALAWLAQPLPADVQVSATVFADSLTPTGVFLRGADLPSGSRSYYSVTVTRGLVVELAESAAGTRRAIASVAPTTYLTGTWVRLTLAAEGKSLKVRVTRADTNQSLTPDGRWVTQPVWAIAAQAAPAAGPGYVGLLRSARYAGPVAFDDFAVVPLAVDTSPPTLTLIAPAAGATVGGTVTLRADARDNVDMDRVELWIDGQRRATLTAAPFAWDLDTRALANGDHVLTVKAYDEAGNADFAQRVFTVRNATSPPPTSALPAIPRHYTHIRLAMLAYSSTPFTDFENGLLRNSVDLVVPSDRYLSQINAVSPTTPQLIYTNFSNLYLSLLTDWLGYADRKGLDREAAFYHVARATPFVGGSPSSIPVTWLWSVRRDAADLTSAARDTRAGDVTFGAAGQSLSLGYPDRFRELNFTLATGAANGWTGVLEYVSATDAAGNPTAWKALTLQNSSTAGFRQSGNVRFDPPADWRPARLSGGALLYYVRVRTLTGGTAPVATTILGRDYVQATYAANGSASGTIPAFDAVADRNADGYLNDFEYGLRAAGKDARFEYESRLFYPYYGQMRLVTNLSSAGVRDWVADYHVRFLNAYPLADGLFVDNSSGRSPAEGIATVEPAGDYANDYATVLAAAGKAVAPRWLMANTVNGNAQTDAVIRQVPSHFEEFAIRALAHNTSQFEDLAAQIEHRQSLSNAPPYMVIDSLPQGGSPTDPRMQIATLAYYYLLGNPQTSFLMLYGGYEPASSWTRHWFDAVKYDIGQPQAEWSVLASGTDPANRALTYKVYQRSYSNALVLYKPLSYARSVGNGTLDAATATTHQLSGTYRPLMANGTLGTAVTSVSLRNGEGAILIKA